MTDETYSTFYRIIGIYEILLIIFGTIGSILTFFVAIRMRQTTTFVFILFLSITDALSLYWWNLDDFIAIYFDRWLQQTTLFGCKAINYFQFVSMQSSAWLLVSATRNHLKPLRTFTRCVLHLKILMTIDRFLSVRLKSWKTTYFKPKQAFNTCVTVVCFFTLLHFNVWFTYGYREKDMNGTYVDYCHSSKTPTIEFMDLWNLVGIILKNLFGIEPIFLSFGVIPFFDI